MSEKNGPIARRDGMSVDPELVRQLADMLTETGLAEIEVEDGDRRIRVSRAAAAAVATPVVASVAAAPAAAAAPIAEPKQDNANAIKSPMVGTAYLTPEPGAPNFVAVGKRVKKGDTLLIVEAMKVMNPITAPAEGTVQAILIDNGTPVEFGQPLIVVA